MARSSSPSRFPPGSLWASAAFLGMYVWCMLLPLVGRAGSRTPHARENFLTVLGVLLLSMLCTGIAVWRNRRAVDSFRETCRGLWCLAVAQGGILVLLVSGLFGI